MRVGRLLATGRGRILDRTGQTILALDDPCYDLVADYAALVDYRAAGEVQRIIADQNVDVEEALARLEQQEDWARNAGLRASVARQAKRLADKEGLSVEQARQQVAQAWADRRAAMEAALRRAAQTAGVPWDNVQRNIDRVISRVTTIRRIVGTRVDEETQKHAVIPGLDLPAKTALAAELDAMPQLALAPSSHRLYPAGEPGLPRHRAGRAGQPGRRAGRPASRRSAAGVSRRRGGRQERRGEDVRRDSPRRPRPAAAAGGPGVGARRAHPRAGRAAEPGRGPPERPDLADGLGRPQRGDCRAGRGQRGRAGDGQRADVRPERLPGQAAAVDRRRGEPAAAEPRGRGRIRRVPRPSRWRAWPGWPRRS